MLDASSVLDAASVLACAFDARSVLASALDATFVLASVLLGMRSALLASVLVALGSALVTTCVSTRLLDSALDVAAWEGLDGGVKGLVFTSGLHNQTNAIA